MKRARTPGKTPIPSPAALDRATPLLRDRIRGVFRRLPGALAGDEAAVHEIRVAARRLRVALPLLARKPEGGRVKRSLKVLRQVTRSAGASRDLDVAVALMAERHDAEATAQWVLLRRRLRAARTRMRARTAEALMDLEIAALRRDLRAVVGRRADVVFVVLRRLRETRTALGAELLAALDALGDKYEPASLHRLRIRVRRLRYLAELADAFRGQASGAPAELKALQDQLGLVQDAWLLSQWFGRQATAARARGQDELAKEARAHRAFFLEASHAHHRAFLAQAPGDAVRRALAAMARTRSAA